MSQDQAPMTRISVRTHPGLNPAERDSVGRTIWRTTARFIGFMGTAARPFAQAWNLAGGPGGQGAVVVSDFMQRFGSPVVQNANKKVYVPRVESSPYIEAFMEQNGQVKISSEVSDSMERVLSARYDAVTASTGDIGY